MLDVVALKDLLGMENKQGYSLNFAGKGLAKIKAEEPTEKELQVELEQSKNFDKTENIIIRGDNLDALKLLRQNYANRIKMIYIDPPYNTGSANCIYEDNFRESKAELIKKYGIDEDAIDSFENMFGLKTHSGWLAFMYPRLKLARDLLTDDGVIFISIDDNEQANLKIICNEIFGEDNFVACFNWITKKGAQGMQTKNMIVANHEYVQVYAKDITKFAFLGEKRTEDGFKNPDNDPRGLWKRQYLQRLGQNLATRTIVNPKNNMKFSFETPYTKENLDKWIREDRIIFPDDPTSYPARKEFLHEYKTQKQLTTSLGLHSTKSSTEKLYELFDNTKIFTNPKPNTIPYYLLQSATKPKDIILDFFAGSGTTAHAVMDLNKEDGGKRQFILVQWDEAIEKGHAAYGFCIENNLDPVISSICIERVNRAGNEIKAEMGSGDNAIDIGYKVFSLIDRPKLSEDNGQLTLNAKRATIKDTLYNMILASGEAILTCPIEEIEKNKVYKVSNSIFVLGECTSDLKQYASIPIYIDGYADINLEEWFDMQGLRAETIRVLS